MTRRVRRQSFADIVEAASAEPARPREVRPGGHNAAGEFFDPAGNLLTKVGKVAPGAARELVRTGALLAFEGCGCGGGLGGCSTQWIAPALALAAAEAAAPRKVRGFGSPSWIDRWAGAGCDVVYVHGDFEWPAAIG